MEAKNRTLSLGNRIGILNEFETKDMERDCE